MPDSLGTKKKKKKKKSKSRRKEESVPDTSRPREWTKELKAVREQILALPGNGVCAECNTKYPDWSSLNLGVMICTQCAGCHRNLGTHVSKVRSIEMDVWTMPQLEYFLQLGGNRLVNSYWEADESAVVRRKPKGSHDRRVLMEYVRDKYERRRFLERKQKLRAASDAASDASESGGGSANSSEDSSSESPSTTESERERRRQRRKKKKKKKKKKNTGSLIESKAVPKHNGSSKGFDMGLATAASSASNMDAMIANFSRDANQSSDQDALAQMDALFR